MRTKNSIRNTIVAFIANLLTIVIVNPTKDIIPNKTYSVTPSPVFGDVTFLDLLDNSSNKSEIALNNPTLSSKSFSLYFILFLSFSTIFFSSKADVQVLI